jgi:hypothetical protein
MRLRRHSRLNMIGEMHVGLYDNRAGLPNPKPKQKEKAEPRKPDKQRAA